MKKLLILPSAVILLLIMLIKATDRLDFWVFLNVTVYGLMVASLIAIIGAIYLVVKGVRTRIFSFTDAAIIAYLLAMPLVMGELALG